MSKMKDAMGHYDDYDNWFVKYIMNPLFYGVIAYIAIQVIGAIIS